MYSLEFEPEALKYLKKLADSDAKRIRADVELL